MSKGRWDSHEVECGMHFEISPVHDVRWLGYINISQPTCSTKNYSFSMVLNLVCFSDFLFSHFTIISRTVWFIAKLTR